jgi:hypothetical protein
LPDYDFCFSVPWFESLTESRTCLSAGAKTGTTAADGNEQFPLLFLMDIHQ